MSNLVIVAIPDENDRVWKVSSEKVPHLTLLFLGESDDVANVDQIVQFVEHAANQTLRRFYLPVDRRDELGEDKADVLFFKKGRYDYKAIRDFRVTLLKDDNIRTAHDSASQHDGVWLPHLTLGYPDKPAKPDDTDRDYGFYDVQFNKIAVWVDDYDGPEFLLKDYWDEWDALETVPMDVAMSSVNQARAALGLDLIESLEHFGVKGMKWGVRKDDLGSAAKSVGNAAGAAGSAVGKAVRGGVRVAKDISFENKVEDGRAREAVISAAYSPFKKEDLPAVKARHGEYGKLLNRAKKPLSKEARAYRKDARETYIKRLESTANSMTNASGDRQYTIRERGVELPAGGGDLPRSKHYWDVSSRKVEHAAADDFTRLELVFDDEGWITDLKKVPVDEALAQTAEMGAELVAAMLDGDEEALEHYGIKGMRWGVRRQSPTAVATVSASKVPHGKKRKTKIQVTGGENHPAHSDALKVAEAQVKMRRSGTAALSNQELREVANRMQLEQQVRQLTTSGGKKFVTGILRSEGQQTSQKLIRKGAKGARKVAIGV